MLTFVIEGFSQLPTSTILLGVLGVGILGKLNQMVNMLAIEHEVLVLDYCERKGIKRDELPSRSNVLARIAKMGG